MFIVDTLGPMILLLALGACLAHIRFLGHDFMGDLNKLVFWVALPALLFISAAEATEPGRQTAMLLAIMIGTPILMASIGWVISLALRMPEESRGALIQASYRGNIAYIGIPVLAYSFSHHIGPKDPSNMATVVVVTAATMAFYNFLSVVVLEVNQQSFKKVDWLRLGQTIGTNPLIVSCLLGLAVSLLHLRIPTFLSSSLHSLGAASVPIALMCIGGALAITPLKGKKSWILTAAVLKVAVQPALAYLCANLLGLGEIEQRIAVVLSACPVAAASFVMAREMRADTALASGAIALSTLLSAMSLAVALWLTS